MRKIILLFLYFISISFIIYAHSGRTDSYGGHYNRSEGTYHYHNGQYAGTGEYTKPVEEGGTKIGSNYLQAYNGDATIGTEEDGEDILREYTSQIEELQSELTGKDETISDLKAKLESGNSEDKQIIEEKEEKIDELKEQQNTMFWYYIIFYLISIFIAYRVGKDK